MHKKLRLREGQRIGFATKPAGVTDVITPLPPGAVISSVFSSKDDVIFWFVKNKSELDAGMEEVLAGLSESNIIWIGYPKGSSGLQTDLNRDIGWEPLMGLPQITLVSFISFDKTWSVFCVRKKTAADAKRKSKQVERPIFRYADSKSKTIVLPDDMAHVFSMNKEAKGIFDALSFSNRREYVEWVVSAKQEETRRQRVNATVEKLMNGLKNPAGR